MNYILLALSAALFTISSSAQDRFHLKVYQNTDYFNTSYYNFETNETIHSNNLNFNRFSFAFAFKTKKNFIHEIEFIIPERSKSIHDVKLPLHYEFNENNYSIGSVSTYSFRYELSKMLFNPSKTFRFNLGLGLNPYFTETEYDPTVAYAYYSNIKIYGVSLNFIPRITYNLTKQILIDLNIPLKIYDLRNEETRNHNPSLPIRQQTSSELSTIFFEDSYTIRVGISYIFQ